MIRADHLTLARLLLLPIPIAMLYQGTTPWRAAALAGFVLLGLTDVLDGPLARRYGPTRIGEALDIVADRAFLAVVYSIFVDLRIVSLPVAILILTREYLVLGLRDLPTVTARTGAAGKLRTTVQMYGAGLLLLLWIPTGRGWITGLLAAALAAAAAHLIGVWRRHRRGDWRSLWATGLVGSLLAAHLLLPARDMMRYVTALVLAVTLATAAVYAWRARGEIAAGLSRRPVEVLRLAGTALLIPLLWAPLLACGPPLSLTVAALAALELARLVLGSDLAGAAASAGRETARLAGLAAAGIAVRWLAESSATGTVAWLATLALCVATALEAAARLRRCARPRLA
jgi:phosphatidylglycerophosphate synthase